MSDTAWLAYARAQIGTREIKGAKHEPKILAWWKAIKRGGIKDDETAWCAAFVGGCLEAVGIVSSRFESARSYLAWGKPLANPVPGCVVVFGRGHELGHTGFVVGRDQFGALMVLSGNAKDMVCVLPFGLSRVLGYRWPAAVPVPTGKNAVLPVLASNDPLSSNEA